MSDKLKITEVEFFPCDDMNNRILLEAARSELRLNASLAVLPGIVWASSILMQWMLSLAPESFPSWIYTFNEVFMVTFAVLFGVAIAVFWPKVKRDKAIVQYLQQCLSKRDHEGA